MSYYDDVRRAKQRIIRLIDGNVTDIMDINRDIFDQYGYGKRWVKGVLDDLVYEGYIKYINEERQIIRTAISKESEQEQQLTAEEEADEVFNDVPRREDDGSEIESNSEGEDGSVNE